MNLDLATITNCVELFFGAGGTAWVGYKVIEKWFPEMLAADRRRENKASDIIEKKDGQILELANRAVEHIALGNDYQRRAEERDNRMIDAVNKVATALDRISESTDRMGRLIDERWNQIEGEFRQSQQLVQSTVTMLQQQRPRTYRHPKIKTA